MIRIDEIYDNTFWPWIRDNIPGMRMFYSDPPGSASPDDLKNFGRDDIEENHYVLFHDQEPVHMSVFESLFNETLFRMGDAFLRVDGAPDSITEIGNYVIFKSGYNSLPEAVQNRLIKRPPGHVVVSERGEFVEQLSNIYDWQTHYYFYHGWACLDWFRGYDRSFLIARARDRSPTRTFMSPNRIVGGMRDHRVLFLYNIFKKNLQNNYISAPRICPYEHVDISIIAQKYTNVYQDIATVFEQAELPRLFAGEETQQMTSCWLGNFAEAEDSLIYVPTETVYWGRRTHITEKTFKAIALEMPFVLIAPAGSLAYLREYGFQTFGDIFDESYDDETDDLRRIERVTDLLAELNSLSLEKKQEIHKRCLPIVEYNRNHFYSGGFADILWQELQAMLNNLKERNQND
jgi:hypothetical protein